MKKFVLASVFVVAASSVFAAESAKQKPTTTTPTTATTATTPSESYFSKAWSKCPSTPVFVVNAKNTTTAWMKENPWKSAAVVAVITVLTVKAIDYTLTNEDEEAGF
ncbi:hypothetical protein KBB68_01910 [Candidatus Babeliales bacterium]|nr:hypothetical protein [Candidatus Babeliales bacterium]